MNRAIRGAGTRRMRVSRNWPNTTRVHLLSIAALQLFITAVESNCFLFYFFKEPTVDYNEKKKKRRYTGLLPAKRKCAVRGYGKGHIR